MTRAEFEKAYATRSKVPLEKLHELGQRGYPCDCGDSSCWGWQMLSRESAETQVELGLMPATALEIHDHDNRLVLQYRDYQIEAFRSESLGGDENLYYTILRKKDLYIVEDTFTSDETPVAEFVEKYLKPMVDDVIKNPKDWYDEEDLVEEVAHGNE